MRIFDAGARPAPATVTSRVVTVPNLITMLRFVALPFVWHALVTGLFWRALVLLAVFSATDWVDGYLARRLDQVTRLGTLLDPLADRALLAVTAIAMVVGGILPLWAVAVVVARDLVVLTAATLLVVGPSEAPQVSRLGKAATAGLFVALPLFVIAAALGEGVTAGAHPVRTVAWVVFVAAVGAYWLAALDYGRRLFEQRRTGTPAGEHHSSR